jgi:hypothetical protein
MTLKCPQCGKKYPIADDYAHLHVKCGKCGTRFAVCESVVPDKPMTRTVEIPQPATPNGFEEDAADVQATQMLARIVNAVALLLLLVTGAYVVGIIWVYGLWTPAMILAAIAAAVYAVWTCIINSDVPDVVYPAIYIPVVVAGSLSLLIILFGDVDGQFRTVVYFVAFGCLAAILFAAIVYLCIHVLATFVKGEWRTLVSACVIAACLGCAANRFSLRAQAERQIASLETALREADQRSVKYAGAFDLHRRRHMVVARAPAVSRPAPVAVIAKAPQPQPVVAQAPLPPPPPPRPQEIRQLRPEEFLKYATDDDLSKDEQKAYGQALALARRTPLPGADERRRQMRLTLDGVNRQYAAQEDAAMKSMAQEQARRDRAKRPTMFGSVSTLHSNAHNDNARMEKQRLDGLRLGEDQQRKAIGADMKQLEAVERIHDWAMEIPVHVAYGQLRKGTVIYNRARSELQDIQGDSSGFASIAGGELQRGGDVLGRKLATRPSGAEGLR